MIDLDLDDLNRRLSPIRWVMIAVAVLCAIVAFCLVANGLGFRWDPFDRAGRKVASAEATASAAVVDGTARTIEAAGAADTTARVEAAHRQTARADHVVADFTPAAKAAPDAEAPLDPDRIARLRGVDDQLCAISPRVCAAPTDAATSRDAGDGRGAVPAAAPAR